MCMSPDRPPQDNPKTLNTQLYIQLYQKKLARFQQFAALYPECYWVFVGDNGQVWQSFQQTLSLPLMCLSAPDSKAIVDAVLQFLTLLIDLDFWQCCTEWEAMIMRRGMCCWRRS